MNYILIGNIIMLASSIIMVSTGLFKTKKKILFMQCIELSLSTTGFIVLGGFTGAVANGLSIIRNVLCYKNKLGIVEKIILTILLSVLTILFNNTGLLGYLPLISAIVYLWLIDIKDIIKFKYMVIGIMSLWCIYDFTVHAYTTFAFDVATIISNIIGIYNIRRDKSVINKENNQ